MTSNVGVIPTGTPRGTQPNRFSIILACSLRVSLPDYFRWHLWIYAPTTLKMSFRTTSSSSRFKRGDSHRIEDAAALTKQFNINPHGAQPLYRQYLVIGSHILLDTRVSPHAYAKDFQDFQSLLPTVYKLQNTKTHGKPLPPVSMLMSTLSHHIGYKSKT